MGNQKDFNGESERSEEAAQNRLALCRQLLACTTVKTIV